MDFDRRGLLMATVAASLMPVLARAHAIDADVRTGTLADVAHVVILTQENRSFDHYFGTMNGVRGFGDRFPIPLANTPDRTGMTCWTQASAAAATPAMIAPFALNTAETFSCMRVLGTPHNWTDAQDAWNEGRMDRWPTVKTVRSMGHYRRDDIPFHYALADAFTLCDAYHCSIQSGTNSNRLFIWTGTNDPMGQGGGPAISNSHDDFADKGGNPDGYRWTTYVERLQKAGVSWRIYQDMVDNFSDNPTAGFQTFRDSHLGLVGSDPKLAELASSTRALDGLRADVMAGTLPQVSYVVAPAPDSEHPGPSSPAQGADYTARVLDALTADPKVWAKTVLLVMYDENDGFFDHAPPPAPPSIVDGHALGGSTVDTAGEYHTVRAASEVKAERDDLMGRPYGLGPRVPMFIISPWSRGGFVNSQVFDHTSITRFLEARFGVAEPNISAWRRTVCGDLTSCFDFKTPNTTPFMAKLPETKPVAVRAKALAGYANPVAPAMLNAPVQAKGVRPSRPLPYDLRVEDAVDGEAVRVRFHNDGKAGAVFHVYDRLHLDRVPRRYTVDAGRSLDGIWEAGDYDLWVLGPNGFHRHLVGATSAGGLSVSLVNGARPGRVRLVLQNAAKAGQTVKITNAYGDGLKPETVSLAAGQRIERPFAVSANSGWYDLEIRTDGEGGFLRRLAGRLETGAASTSDPLMGGDAVMQQAGTARLA